jgi:hypothetical protein
MKSKSIKALKFSKNSVSILGGIDGESEPSGGSNAAPSGNGGHS